MAILDIVSEFAKREGRSNVLEDNWYTVAVRRGLNYIDITDWLIVLQAAAIAAANRGKDIPGLYRLATQNLNLEQQKLVQRRLKEAILKTSILYGIPRALQALWPLFATLKDEEIDHYGPR